jgi:hypothetical protein
MQMSEGKVNVPNVRFHACLRACESGRDRNGSSEPQTGRSEWGNGVNRTGLGRGL